MRPIKPIFILLILALLAGCATPQPTATATPQPSPEPTTTPVAEEAPWWKSAVFYEIFVRSFYDSDGDGIGDFKGIVQKLDYLNDGDPQTSDDLGITAIWLMPIHPSPSYHGYDVLNYYAVNSEYGTLEDFKTLLAEAHQRGIRVIIDLVLNHTSVQHPFFRDALRGPDSTYRDWYIWSDSDQGAGWHKTQGGSTYYYGYFCYCMPDLNYFNPAVTEQMEKVSRYWLETVGVDGFRVDAAKHLIEESAAKENSPATHDWFKGFYTFYKDIDPEAYVVGEVAASDARMTSTYTGNQFDQIFNFEMASGVVNAVNGGAYSGIQGAVTFARQDMPDWNFGTFLTNHDQDRVMSVLGGDENKAKLAAFILLTSPGTPYIYYGEEIGMMGRKPDELIRRPMQWSAEANGGFTGGTPWEELDPASTATVTQQQADENSLLSTYRRLITIRQREPALSLGGYVPAAASNRGVYAYLRSDGFSTFLIVVNLGKNPVSEYTLTAENLSLSDGNYSVMDYVLQETANPLTVSDGGFVNYQPVGELAPLQGRIYKIGE